jgi:hypothetical protein
MSKVLGNFLSQLTTKLALALVIAAFLTLMAPTAEAQLYRGAVTGTVSDPQNLAIADVQVIITNQETGVVQTTTTSDKGVYRLPVDAGTYAVDFTKMGFQTHKYGTVEVTSAKDSTVNAKLTVGAVSSQVHVTAQAIELDKSSATVRLTLPGKVLDDIPLGTSSLVPGGSRNFARYALFAPGVSRGLFQNETSANGHRGRENNYMLDGTDNNDQTVTLPALFVPPEAIREVDVQTAPFSAEWGRNIGAQINVITKSGTNSYRGEVWEFYRGNALEPLSLASRIAGQTRPPRLVDNQFGGAFGGPVIKNKTFFFGMVQGNLLRTGPRPQSAVTIPTAAGYAALQTVALRSAPTAQSQASRDAMLAAISFLPEAHAGIANFDSTTNTTTVNGTAIEMGTFRPVIPTRQNIWYGVTRLDHQLTENDKLTYRGHIDRRISPLSSGYLAFDGRWGVDNKYFAQNHFIGYTRNIGSSFVNEARVSYARLFPSFEERDKVTPTINITGAMQVGGSASFPQERLEQTYQFQNVSTYIRSRHTLKFGFDLARINHDSNNAPNSRGTWNFASLQNFMNSTPTSLTYLFSAPFRYEFNNLRQAYFFQDDFKVTRNLTANLGLRYETSSVPLGFLGATTTEVLNAMGQPPTKRDKNNWAPRVGFAYSPDAESGLLGKLFGNGKSSIRGGFGIGYDVLFYSLIASGPAQNYPRNDTQSFSGAAAPIDVFPTLPPKVTSPTLTSSSVLIYIPSDAQNPTTHYWSLSIQRQLRSDYTLELGYNGNRSYHLIRQGQANPGQLSPAKAAAVIAGCTTATIATCESPAGFHRSPSNAIATDRGRINPNWDNRTLLETTGIGAYHGAYVQMSGRTAFGLRFGANYTFSANFSDSEEFSNDSVGSADGGLAGSSPQVPQDYFNQRNDWSRSVFDRPHRATFHYSYDIPWFRSTFPVLDHVMKGWQWSGFTEMQSGQPFTIRVGVDALGNGTAAGARPDYNPNGIITLDPSTGDFRTFVTPKNGTGIVTAPFVVTNVTTGAVQFLRNSMPTGGNLGRNTFRGPGYANFNMSLAKKIELPGERLLTIRGDFINVFNHDNFPNPDNNMTSTNFGRQIFLPLTDARQVLIGAKLAF